MHEEYTPEIMHDPQKLKSHWKSRIIGAVIVLLIIAAVFIFLDLIGNDYGGRVDTDLLKQDGYTISVDYLSDPDRFEGDYWFRNAVPESPEDILKACEKIMGKQGFPTIERYAVLASFCSYILTISSEKVIYHIILERHITVPNVPKIWIYTELISDDEAFNEKMLERMDGQYWHSTMQPEDYALLLELLEECRPPAETISK